jgi:hypothetical protein
VGDLFLFLYHHTHDRPTRAFCIGILYDPQMGFAFCFLYFVSPTNGFCNSRSHTPHHTTPRSTAAHTKHRLVHFVSAFLYHPQMDFAFCILYHPQMVFTFCILYHPQMVFAILGHTRVVIVCCCVGVTENLFCN